MIQNVVEAWCSGLTCHPVKVEIAGSNPVASVKIAYSKRRAKMLSALTVSQQEAVVFRRKEVSVSLFSESNMRGTLV